MSQDAQSADAVLLLIELHRTAAKLESVVMLQSLRNTFRALRFDGRKVGTGDVTITMAQQEEIISKVYKHTQLLCKLHDEIVDALETEHGANVLNFNALRLAQERETKLAFAVLEEVIEEFKEQPDLCCDGSSMAARLQELAEAIDAKRTARAAREGGSAYEHV